MNQSFFERISSLNIRCMLIFLLCVKTFTMKAEENPNIIMIMADDLGWGDVGFNGNTVIRTPHLDDLASEGINFKRFYSASPVCSPTRGSCLTGRHPYRYGIEFAMSGHIKKEELLIPEILKDKGYTTGHFGKWHLGTLTLKEQNRWGEWEKDPVANYSPPWENGVDFCFVTESKVPTWNPMLTPENWSNMEPGSSFGNDYWTGPGKKETHNLEGDDSRVIMDRVIPFVEKAEQLNQPFFAVIWFHTPHKPVVAGPQYKSIYKDFANSEQNYYGCITAMDEQVGRLNNKLKELGIDQNTIIWFCSDNGPEGVKPGEKELGSAGPFRGLKRSLLEGGVRVPAFMVWPRKVQTNSSTEIPCVTSDYFPTIMDILGIDSLKNQNPMDGISLLPLIEGKMKRRDKPIGFQSQNSKSWNSEDYKLYSEDAGKTFALYHLPTDPHEDYDLSDKYPLIVEKLKAELLNWEKSCERSAMGLDYIKE
jgi:arylsulfatase A-like enzyme